MSTELGYPAEWQAKWRAKDHGPGWAARVTRLHPVVSTNDDLDLFGQIIRQARIEAERQRGWTQDADGFYGPSPLTLVRDAAE